MLPRPRPAARRRRVLRAGAAAMAGLAMMEALVAMVLIALWFLGSATLQLNSMKFQRTAGNRFMAVSLAGELGESIEANAGGANAGAYALSATTKPVDSTADCTSAYCSPAQLASYNLAQWSARVAGTLPLEEMSVTRAVGADGLTNYTIRISWREPYTQRMKAGEPTTETLSVVMTKTVRHAGA